MKIFFQLVIICLLSFWCCKPQSTVTESTLTDEQLARMLFDVQLTDVILNEQKGLEQDTLQQLLRKRMTDIYKLSPEEIQAEIDNLNADPVRMKRVMVITRDMIDSIQ